MEVASRIPVRAVRTRIARWKPLQRRLESAISVPGLPRRAVQPGSVWAVVICRDEDDVVGHSIQHMLDQGVDGIIAIDNVSTDGTPAVLRDIARRDPRVFAGTDSLDLWYQGRKTSYAAWLARRAGAEWVVPFDADEFWLARHGTVAEHLRSVDGASVVRCAVHDVRPLAEDGLVLADDSTRLHLDDAPSMTKVALRPDGFVWINDGNHEAADLPGPRQDGLFAAHLPHRSFAQFSRKVSQGARALRAADALPDHFGHHWKEAADASDEERRRMWRDRIAAGSERPLPLPSSWTSWPLAPDSATAPTKQTSTD